MEALEDRLVPANILWRSNQSGAWNVAANWTDANGGHRLPTSADDVFIDSSAAMTVTLGPGTVTVHSLHAAAGDTLNLAGGSLTVLRLPNLAGAFPGASGAVLNVAGISNTSGSTTIPLPSLALPIVANAVTPAALRAAALPTTTLFAAYATGTGESQMLVSQSNSGGTAAEEGASAPPLDDPTPLAPPEPDPGAAHRPHQTDQVFALAVDRLRTGPGTNVTPTDFQTTEQVTDATFMSLGQEKKWTLADPAATANESGPASGVWACVGLLALVPVKDRKWTDPHT